MRLPPIKVRIRALLALFFVGLGLATLFVLRHTGSVGDLLVQAQAGEAGSFVAQAQALERDLLRLC